MLPVDALRPPRRLRGNRFISVMACVVVGAVAGSTHASQPYEVVVDKNVAASMRDGVVLRADVYRPDAPGRYPALLRRTPYSKSSGNSAERFRRLSSHGYVVVVQDTRGRYTSDGMAVPHDEASDGFDTVEWVASLPYVDGKVGMYGGSYLATTQLMAASLAPPHLVAIAPSSSYSSRYDMVFQGGVFYLSDGLYWNLGQAADVRRRRAGTPFEDRDGPIGLTPAQRVLVRDELLWQLPLTAMDTLDIRSLAPGYFQMLAHPSDDEFWQTFDIASRHGSFETPALHVTGWYDTLLRGTLENFSGLRAGAGTGEARRGQRLIVGPWTHSGPTLASTSIGDIDFGPDAGLDYEDLLLRWYDFWLRGGDASVMDSAPVRIFVMGANRWRDERQWPLSRAQPVRYYLHSGGHANTVGGDGFLSVVAPAHEAPDRYIYDPADPVATGAMSGYSRAPADPSHVETRSDVLVYSSEAMPADLEVTGYIELVLWVASSAPDTDFTGKLIDVASDGSARTLTDGILRTRYRNGKMSPELLAPGVPVELRIDLLATSNVFQKGHRIRLEISSSNFPRFDRNLNTGATFGVDAELRTAEQSVFHDVRRPSYLLLPVVPATRRASLE